MRYDLCNTTNGLSPYGVFHEEKGGAVHYGTLERALYNYEFVVSKTERGPCSWIYSDFQSTIVPGVLL